MLERPRAVLFDLGGTLLKVHEFDPVAGTERVLSFADNPRGLSAVDVCEQVEALEVDLRERREASWMEMSPFTVHRLVYEPNRIAFDRPFAEVELAFWRAAMRVELSDGVRAFLEFLRAEEILQGVVSNSTFTSETLIRQLDDSGLGAFFAFVMSSADYVVRKPHPVLFRTACRKLDLPCASVWYVGDNTKYDVVGAANAGLVSVLYRPSGNDGREPKPDLSVRAWTELQDIIQGAS